MIRRARSIGLDFVREFARDGTKVDISLYGSGLQVVPIGRTARLIPEDDRVVAESATSVSDDDVFGLLESIRR